MDSGAFDKRSTQTEQSSLSSTELGSADGYAYRLLLGCARGTDAGCE
jgi:hypothetical protein